MARRSTLTPNGEALVLNWLLEQSEIAKAVDLATAGSELEARPALVEALGALQRRTRKADRSTVETLSVASPPTPPSPVSIYDAPNDMPPPKRPRQQAAAESSTPGRPRQAADAGEWQPARQRWKVNVPEVLSILGKSGILPGNFQPVASPEVFLLQPGAAFDDEEDAKHLGIHLDHYVAMREALEALKGTEFEVTVTELIIDRNMACARVALPPVVACQHKVPHILLGGRVGVGRNHAVKMLSDLQRLGSKKQGVTVIPLAVSKSRTIKGRLELGS